MATQCYSANSILYLPNSLNFFIILKKITKHVTANYCNVYVRAMTNIARGVFNFARMKSAQYPRCYDFRHIIEHKLNLLSLCNLPGIPPM